MSRCGIALEMNQLANCQMIRKVLQCCSCSGPVVLLAHIFVIEISEEFLSITSSCAKTTKPGTQSRKNYLKKKKVKHPKNFNVEWSLSAANCWHQCWCDLQAVCYNSQFIVVGAESCCLCNVQCIKRSIFSLFSIAYCLLWQCTASKVFRQVHFFLSKKIFA